VEKRFEDFARRPISDASRTTEGIFALTAGSRAEVDQAGGSRAADPMDPLGSLLHGAAGPGALTGIPRRHLRI
jgi:hypothetical protein